MLENIVREGIETLDGSENGQARARAPPGRIEVPRILYHGTTFGYLNQRFKLFGKYKGPFDGICLGRHYAESISAALERSSEYEDIPVLLIIDSHKMTSPIALDRGVLKTDTINTGCYSICGLPPRGRKVTPENIFAPVRYFEKYVISTPFDKLKRETELRLGTI